jgi:ABC-2 type transport system ATP-binding protein
MPQVMIESRGLRRVYKTKKEEVEAVRGVDFTVHAGEIVGFLGPNGAGKTTTLRMLTTLLEPTGGEATVAGSDLRLDPVGVRRRIGYVAQGGSTDPEARAGEEIVDHARMYGIDAKVARVNGESLFDQLDLSGLWHRQCKTLSGGQRRRLDVAMGLVHRPVLVFLDEPSTGLDPQSRANLWEHIGRLRSDFDTTVFITTHYMDEADVLCDRILVIDDGAIVAQGTPEELKRKVAGDSVVLSFEYQRSTVVVAELVTHLEGATDPSIEGTEVRFQVPDGASALPVLLRAMVERDLDAAGVEVHRPTLDDVFLTMTGRSLRDEVQTGPTDRAAA